MVVFISDKQVLSNLKTLGYVDIDSKIPDIINASAFALVKTTLEKAMKKAVLKGGRVTMPSEYYGVQTSHHVENPSSTDMSVTEARIRPAFEALLTGGGPVFKLSFNATRNMCTEVINTASNEVIVRQTAMKKIHYKLIAKLSELMTSISKKVKGTSLKAADVTAILKLKKYSDLSA
jgi:hypothetical protein